MDAPSSKKRKHKHRPKHANDETEAPKQHINPIIPSSPSLDKAEQQQPPLSNSALLPSASSTIATTKDYAANPSSSDNSDVNAAFERHYLEMMTAEFADELDALRAAGDFTEGSVPILVGALRQGASIFSVEEKRAVLRDC